MAKPPMSTVSELVGTSHSCLNRTSCTAATSELFDHFISSNERRLSQRHTERTAFTLGAYRLTSFAFQILRKMIASCRPGDGR